MSVTNSKVKPTEIQRELERKVCSCKSPNQPHCPRCGSHYYTNGSCLDCSMKGGFILELQKIVNEYTPLDDSDSYSQGFISGLNTAISLARSKKWISL